MKIKGNVMWFKKEKEIRKEITELRQRINDYENRIYKLNQEFFDKIEKLKRIIKYSKDKSSFHLMDNRKLLNQIGEACSEKIKCSECNKRVECRKDINEKSFKIKKL